MKAKYYFFDPACLLLLAFMILSLPGSHAQLIAFTGKDVTGSNEFSFVALENIPAGTIIYFADDSYNNVSNAFELDAMMDDAHLSYTPPVGGLIMGQVVIITEGPTNNTFTVSGAGGTAVRVSLTNNWQLFQAEPIYAYASNDALSPWDNVTEIYAMLETSHSDISNTEDPTSDYPNAIAVDLDPAPINVQAADFKDSERINTQLSDFYNINNYTLSNASLTLSTTNFTNLLPVELISFHGRTAPTGIRLHWQTALEIMNHGFELQHRSREGDWSVRAFIPGKGNSEHIQQYTWLDAQPAVGLNYYRLRQIDWNGQYSFSKAIVVESGARSNTPALYPVPATDRLFLSTSELTGRSAEILTASGNTLSTLVIPENHEINIAALPSGSYFLNVEGQILPFIKH
jgi:hypothetical protein